VASQQPHAFYQALSTNRAWLEAWISGGGMLEFHGAAYGFDDWSGLPMPGGFTMVYETSEEVSILNATHRIMIHPNNINLAELLDWGYSTHGYLVDLPAGVIRIISHEPSGIPTTVKFGLGDGCVVATEQPLEWGWDGEYSPILENFILHDNCQINNLGYLPMIVKAAP